MVLHLGWAAAEPYRRFISEPRRVDAEFSQALKQCGARCECSVSGPRRSGRQSTGETCGIQNSLPMASTCGDADVAMPLAFSQYAMRCWSAVFQDGESAMSDCKQLRRAIAVDFLPKQTADEPLEHDERLAATPWQVCSRFAD